MNSDFAHACISVKNCYNVFWSYFSEDSENSYAILLSKKGFDCYTVDNSDQVYEGLHSNRLYKARYSYFSEDCLDSAFLYGCVGLSDCFGCVNLRKQKYSLFNEQFSKAEYQERIKEYDLGSYAKLEKTKQKFRELYLSLPQRYAHVLNSVDVTGDIIRDAKNCKTCFVAFDGVENCKYVYFAGLSLKDSVDVSAGGDTSELLYETYGVTSASRCFFSAGGTNSEETWYSDWSGNSAHLFGCISLKNKRYCILNKQYERTEYEALVARIKQHMDEMPYVDAKGRPYAFGEFFPPELSAYAYNESQAFAWYPKTESEAISDGWRWQDPPERSYAVSMRPEDLPDHIRDVPDSITKEIIGCAHAAEAATCNERCTTAFRLTAEEVAFYRHMNIALPRLCPNCRNGERLQWRNGFTLYRRACACKGKTAGGKEGKAYENIASHFHGDAPCPNEFETTFAPEKPEIIYCAECYKAEYL